MRLVILAAGLVIGLWLMYQLVEALLLAFFALVIAIALAAPVTWLERRRWPRWLAALAVFAVVALTCAALAWMVVPRVGEQLVDLAEALPGVAQSISDNVSSWLEDAPDLQQAIRGKGSALAKVVPGLSTFVSRLGTWSISFVTLILLVLVVIAIVIYVVVDPRPLVRGYVRLLPEHLREPCTRALARASSMVVAWMRANVIVGAIEAVTVALVLSVLGVPAPFVWAALAFFAEFVPKLGPYLMATPPTIVALSVSPMTALWVALFYFALNELMGDAVVPYVRGRAMQIHPALLVFAAVAMGLGFGILGALIATPLTAFIMAFVDELVLARRQQPSDGELDRAVDAVLAREPDAVELGH